MADRPDGFFADGHFWVREFVLGRAVAVRMDESGLLTFAGPEGEFDAEEPPWSLRRSIEAVRSNLDRDRLRNAADDAGAYTFYLLAPLSIGIDYDFDTLPPALGVDIWDSSAGEYTTLDVTERVFEGIGLWTAPTIAREVPARDLSPETYELPRSHWADEQAAGVVFRKKHGGAVRLLRTPFENTTWESPESAGVPDFDDWIGAHLDADRARSLLKRTDQSLDSVGIEAATALIGASLAQRQYATVGQIADSDPERFRTAIRDRLVEIRETEASESAS
ncbi:hypothetical protein RH831_07450 [Halodesulfurarchaeum sp. HSR-GB]|uniref:hypothetical protein n=1 Tax=Halodesulfurarchaeum sp. HSR-GB TaxID=3074077 RepID=UPI0028639467|nr:hypothetical protein [Halodesulfurarchaeum sp. HSR-GB]MDR5657016.1 hypothetical protein [Halodesulfurarchaeum sp. HSR-GB]